MISNNRNDNQVYGLFFIKLGLLLFWASWFAIAFITNTTDFLITKQIVTTSPFHSGNYNALKSVISIYHTTDSTLYLLFLLDISAQGISSILFFTATFCYWNKTNFWPSTNLAFGISMCLWATFIIFEEIFIAYSYEAAHIRLFMFEIISLLALHLLPHQQEK